MAEDEDGGEAQAPHAESPLPSVIRDLLGTDAAGTLESIRQMHGSASADVAATLESVRQAESWIGGFKSHAELIDEVNRSNELLRESVPIYDVGLRPEVQTAIFAERTADAVDALAKEATEANRVNKLQLVLGAAILVVALATLIVALVR